MMRNYVLVFFAFFVVGCGDGAKSVSVVEPTFRMVDPPLTLTDPAARLEWVAVNYWNNSSFADTVFLNSDVMEQAYVDWINLLANVPAPTADRAIGSTMHRTDSTTTARTRFNALAERYLYDPNSPMRNENIYIIVLRHMMASAVLDSVEKIRPAAHLQMALKNRVGDRAAEFSYEDIDGLKGSLGALRAPYTLLFFNNPDCTACKEIREALSASPAVDELQKSGKLRILAIYTDEDLAAWKRYAPNIPARWINAQNKELHTSRQYDLKAIPTLYLLDKDKKVLLKDVDFRQLIPYLEQLKTNN